MGREVKMSIDEIYEKLIQLKYTARMYRGNDTYTIDVINKEGRDVFRVALADALSDQFNEYKAKIATLEAKVFAYEAILKNSNFAMAVTDKEKEMTPCNNCIENECEVNGYVCPLYKKYQEWKEDNNEVN